MVVVPAFAALTVTARSGRWQELGHRVRLRRGPLLSWLVAVAAMPPIVLASSGGRFENPGWSILVLSVVFLVGAAAEELGWTGFVLPRLRRVVGELGAGVAIGLAWAVWHIIPWAQTGYTAAEVVGLCVFSIAFRVVLVRIATAADDSVWPAVVGHGVYNLAWAVSPNVDLDYDPWTAAVLTTALAAWLYLTKRSNATTSPVPLRRRRSASRRPL
jgi:membrane protease YdiL (CAAX protease family)